MTNSYLIRTFSVFFHLFLFFTMMIPTNVLAQEVQIENTSEYIDSGHYKWTVFLLAENSILETIDHVEYTLHPSFPNPERISNEHDTNFAISFSGWGESIVYIKIVFRDGQKMHTKHRLSLEEKNKEDIEILTTPHSEFGEIITNNTARFLGNELWEWTVFIETDRETLSQIEYVEYILHPTFQESIRRVYSTDNDFSLTATGWGSFEIKIRVIFKDNTERYLTHLLEFEQNSFEKLK